MTQRRILFLDHSTALGGAEISLLLMLQGLDKTRWFPILCCPPGVLQIEGKKLQIDTIEIQLPRLRKSPRAISDLFTKGRLIAGIARAYSVNLICANTVRSAVYCSFAAWLNTIPFVWHMRDFWLSEEEPKVHSLDWFGKRLIGSRAAAIFANSHSVANSLPYRDKVKVLYNGVDLHRYHRSGKESEYRLKFGIPVDSLVIGAVGRLRPWKGIDRFIHMAAEVLNFNADVYFLVVGGSPFGVQDDYAESLPRLARQLNISDRVIFTGHLEDVRPALEVMDIFVHAGDPEPFGRVNIEAMAMQVPGVAFAHGALPEIVADSETGILAPPGQVGGLVKGVLALLESPNNRTRMGRAGRLRVESKFSATRMVSELSNGMEELIKS